MVLPYWLLWYPVEIPTPEIYSGSRTLWCVLQEMMTFDWTSATFESRARIPDTYASACNIMLWLKQWITWQATPSALGKRSKMLNIPRTFLLIIRIITAKLQSLSHQPVAASAHNLKLIQSTYMLTSSLNWIYRAGVLTKGVINSR